LKEAEVVVNTVIRMSVPMIRLRGGNRYLDLLKRSLTNLIYDDDVNTMPWQSGVKVKRENRLVGDVWPSRAKTMVGRVRLDHLQYCVEEVVRRGVPGVLMETGVWRGGASILMTAVLQDMGEYARRVYVCDSFAGLPPPRLKEDEGAKWHEYDSLAVSIEEVQDNFRRYGIVDHSRGAANIHFLKGWFNETMPQAAEGIDQIAVLRLDGDMFESTMDVLTHMYPKVAIGGYVIVDDFAIQECARAVMLYRALQGIQEPMFSLTGGAVYWRRTLPALMPPMVFSKKAYKLKPEAQTEPRPYRVDHDAAAL